MKTPVLFFILLVLAGIVNAAPPTGNWSPLPADVAFVTRLSGSTDLVHVFTASKAELRELLQKYRAGLKPDGVVWVSWPKKAAKVPTDITEDTIREVALPMGFVDIKVCAVNGIWSGLKLVVRKDLR